jgi:hypothetical protein
MPIFWEPMLLFPLLALVIPVAILIGQRWRGGPLISLSAGATLGVVIYLALMWSSFSADPNHIYDNSTVETLSLVGGAILLLGAGAVAFTDALRGQRRGWAFIQCALVYGSFAGMVGFSVSPVRFCGALPSGEFCASPDLGRFALFAALTLAGPVATLVYALLAQGRTAAAPAQLEQPEGLTISRLTAEEG